jgi:F0F1-type ATP synthase assembly protein I
MESSMRLLLSLPLSALTLLAASDFPWWLRASHWINAFFIGYLIRSGIQILSPSLLDRRQHAGT